MGDYVIPAAFRMSSRISGRDLNTESSFCVSSPLAMVSEETSWGGDPRIRVVDEYEIVAN